MRTITEDQCNSTEEVCGLFRGIFTNMEQIEAKIIQLSTKQESTDIEVKRVDVDLSKVISAFTDKAKKKGKKMKSKGFALTRVLAILMLVTAIADLCYAAYVPSDITYEIADNPEMLTTYLRDVTGTMISDSYLFTPTLAADAPPLADGRVWYNNTTNILQISLDGTSWTNIALAGGNSLDAAYDVSEEITVDSGTAVTFTSPDNSGNQCLLLTQSDVTNDGDALSIANAANLGTAVSIDIDGTAGYDIQGTGDLWEISVAGVGDFAGIIVGGTDIVLENSEKIMNDTDHEIEFSDSAANYEDISFVFGNNNNIIGLATDSAADTFEFGVIDDVNGVENIIFDNASCSLTLDGNTDGHDLTISHTADGGTDNSSIILDSAGTGDDANKIISSVGGVDIDAVKSVTITSTENTADALKFNATIGGVQISADAAGPGEDVTITSTGSSTHITATEAGVLDAFNLDVTGAISGVDVDTTNGPIVLTAAHADNGDVTLVAADVMTLTSVDTKIFDGAATEVWIIEGAVDAHETTISFTQPAADVTYTFPTGGTDILAVMSSTLATNYPEVANSVTGGTNQLIFEGAGVDDHEHIIQSTDATADIIWLLPDGGTDTLAIMGSTLTTNYPEIANSVWMASNAIHFEGTANTEETILTANDATTADATIELPNDSGDIAYAPVGVVDYAAGAGALPITHVCITYESVAAPDALSIPDGQPGQILHVCHDTDGGNGVITPDTALGYTSIDLADDGDMVTFMFVDTQGWIIIGTAGNVAPPVVTP